jgi:hypothetical protein
LIGRQTSHLSIAKPHEIKITLMSLLDKFLSLADKFATIAASTMLAKYLSVRNRSRHAQNSQ